MMINANTQEMSTKTESF